MAFRRISAAAVWSLLTLSGAAEDGLSYIRVDTAGLFDSSLYCELSAAGQMEIPLLGRLETEAGRLGTELSALRPDVWFFPDWEEPEASVARLFFPDASSMDLLVEAAEKNRLFSVKNGTDGKIICLNRAEDEAPVYVLAFVSSNLVWAGEESAVEEWKLRAAGGPGRLPAEIFLDMHGATAQCLLHFQRSNTAALLGGAESISASLYLNDGLELSGDIRGPDPAKIRSNLLGWYTLGVALFFNSDRELRDELLELPKWRVLKNGISFSLKLGPELAHRMVDEANARAAEWKKINQVESEEDGW